MKQLPRLSPPYKSPNNAWYTAALFWDMVITRTLEQRMIQPVFTLHEDKEGYVNCRKTFVELGDPTGYKWAMKYLGDWAHWKELVKAKWFAKALEEWREELRIKIQSEALDVIRAVSITDDKQALVAAKYLAEYGWVKAGTGRGRPSKAEVQGELKKAVEAISVEDEDAKRIGLVK